MIHQIKAQLNSSLKKIERQSEIEVLCSKLSATLAMASALDELEKLDFINCLYSQLYRSVSEDICRIIAKIDSYEKKEEPTE